MLGRLLLAGRLCVAALWEAACLRVGKAQALAIYWLPTPSSPLADRAIGNLQQWLTGTHHGVSREQLQVCLDEFVFRLNRRRLPLAAFQTRLGLGTRRKPTPYKEIRGAGYLSNHDQNPLGLAETTG